MSNILDIDTPLSNREEIKKIKESKDPSKSLELIKDYYKKLDKKQLEEQKLKKLLEKDSELTSEEKKLLEKYEIKYEKKNTEDLTPEKIKKLQEEDSEKLLQDVTIDAIKNAIEKGTPLETIKEKLPDYSKIIGDEYNNFTEKNKIASTKFAFGKKKSRKKRSKKRSKKHSKKLSKKHSKKRSKKR